MLWVEGPQDVGATFDGEAAPASASPASLAMDRYADGDDSAFSALYDALAPRLYRFALRQSRNAATAEDIVQQTMMQIHCARDRFRRGADVVPWSFAIARRLHIDLTRKAKHRELLSSDGETTETASAPSAYSPHEALAGKQLEADAIAVLETISEGNREAFMLVRIDGLSVVEAAEVLGISVSAVKVRAHRAYEAIREALAKRDRQ